MAKTGEPANQVESFIRFNHLLALMVSQPRGRESTTHREEFQPWMHADDTRVNRLSECVIACAFKVINTLRSGFLEKNYENALPHELRKGLPPRRRGPG
jgi:hypothetical protein